MKPVFAPRLVVVAAMLSACGAAGRAPEVATTAAALSPASFATAYACSGAQLDVDTGERRNLRFVISDLGSVAYLESKMPAGVSLGNQAVVAPFSTRRGTIWANAAAGIFHPANFTQVFADNLAGSQDSEIAVLARQADGIKLTVARASNVDFHCAKPGPESSCLGTVTARVLKADANWFYHCEAAF